MNDTFFRVCIPLFFNNTKIFSLWKKNRPPLHGKVVGLDERWLVLRNNLDKTVWYRRGSLLPRRHGHAIGRNVLEVRPDLFFAARDCIARAVPFAIGIYSSKYLITAPLGIGIPLAYIISLLVKSPSSNNCHTASQIMKFSVFLGLLAVYLG